MSAWGVDGEQLEVLVPEPGMMALRASVPDQMRCAGHRWPQDTATSPSLLEGQIWLL